MRLEWFGNYIDARVNFYIPVGRQKYYSGEKIYNHYIGDYRATCYDEQRLNKGINMEIAKKFFLRNYLTAEGAFGPYYYFSKREQYLGGEGRIEISYNSFLSVQVKCCYDSVNRVQIQSQLCVTIPFASGYTGKILQSVQRNHPIFIEKCCNYTWNW